LGFRGIPMALYGSAYPLLVGLFVLFNSASAPFSTERYYRVDPAPDVDCPMSENVQAASVRLRTPPTGILHAVRKVDLEGLRVCSAGRTSRFVGNRRVCCRPFAHAHMKPHDLLWARLRRIRLWMSVSPINHSAEAHPRFKSQFLSQRHLPSLSMLAELG